MNTATGAANMAERLSHCRVCGRPLFEKPLLQYKNMPGAAQYLPDAAGVANDCGIDLEICQCSGCGLVQLNNAPVPYYREVIRASAVSEDMKNFRLSQFADFAARFSLKNKKILEIGCGRGEYLSLMKPFVGEAVGLEYGESAVQQCLSRGLTVSRGFIEDERTCLEHGPFDAFFILNFLEHLPDPNATLRGIYNNLADGAAGLVEVPNFDMMLRDCLFSEFISDHLLYFTRDTLRQTLGANGFDIIDCDAIRSDYIIAAVVQKRRRLDLDAFNQVEEQFRKEVGAYIGGYRQVAVWGAGHQAFTFLSLMNIQDRIRYVVDSAPFKQNRYTPATHLPIVAPNALQSDPVDAVIVIAGSYTNEVARILQERFGATIGIARLEADRIEKLQ